MYIIYTVFIQHIIYRYYSIDRYNYNIYNIDVVYFSFSKYKIDVL